MKRTGMINDSVGGPWEVKVHLKVFSCLNIFFRYDDDDEGMEEITFNPILISSFRVHIIIQLINSNLKSFFLLPF